MRFFCLLFCSSLLFSVDKTVDPEEVVSACEAIEAKPHFKMVRNILSQNSVGNVSRNWDLIRNVDHTFSCEIEPDLLATNQKMTGRCWMFAGLNALRIPFAKKHKLLDFEFSESYLFFYDKIEQANLFLEQMISLGSDKKISPLLRGTLQMPVQDGNFISSFFALVEKYGLVPKSVYPESAACFHSGVLNRILKMKLLKGAQRIRSHFLSQGTEKEARNIKKDVMRDVYKIMVVHMGTPPKHFTWSYSDFEGTFHRHEKVTPKQFSKEYVGASFEDYVILFHFDHPDFPMFQKYAVKNLTTVLGKKPYTVLNVPIATMKSAVKKSIKEEKKPVIFAADIFTVDPETGILDPHLFDFQPLYDVDFSMSRKDKYMLSLSNPNHEMLLTGLDEVDGKVTKWKVENSWGIDVGNRGCFVMTNDWFSEYVYEVVVPKAVLGEKMRKALSHKAREIEAEDFFEPVFDAAQDTRLISEERM